MRYMEVMCCNIPFTPAPAYTNCFLLPSPPVVLRLRVHIYVQPAQASG